MSELTKHDVAAAIRSHRFYELWDFNTLRNDKGRHRLFGQEIPDDLWGKAFSMAMRGFPRSEKEREQRMARYIQWRAKVREDSYRRKLHWILMWALTWLIAPPVVISLVAALYRVAVLAVMS